MRNSHVKRGAALVIALAFVLSVFTPIQAEAASWQRNTTGWWWQKDNNSYSANCWEFINGKWYHFDQNGYMQTGWQLINGSWYYLGDANDGAMKTGWQLIAGNWYYLGDANDGAMKTGWQLVNGVYYYMYSDGRMAADTWIGSYYVNGSGAWVERGTGGTWIPSGGQWWYRHSDGSYTKSDWEAINGKWYYFDADGWMCTGWQRVNGKWYYLGADGAMLADQWIGDYYVGPYGDMQTDTWIGNWYVDSTGKADYSKNKRVYTIDLGNGNSTTVAGYYNDGFEARVIELLNAYRVANGLNPLEPQPFLAQQADVRGYEIVYSFDHTRPNGTSCFTLLSGGNYMGAGENIAAGYMTPEQVMEGWKNSPGHNANMLDPDFKYIGVSAFISDGTTYTTYWVQMFAY